jgi:hypothetical protein
LIQVARSEAAAAAAIFLLLLLLQCFYRCCCCNAFTANPSPSRYPEFGEGSKTEIVAVMLHFSP